MPSVISGGYHSMCRNTLTIPHAFSLFLYPILHCLPRCTDCMFALRSSFDHFKVQTNNCIPAAHFGFACVCGTGVSVARAAPGVRAGVSDGCVRHGAGRRKRIPDLRATQVVRTGVADVAFSLALDLDFVLARSLSFSLAPSLLLSLSLSLSLIHTQTCWVRLY